MTATRCSNKGTWCRKPNDTATSQAGASSASYRLAPANRASMTSRLWKRTSRCDSPSEALPLSAAPPLAGPAEAIREPPSPCTISGRGHQAVAVVHGVERAGGWRKRFGQERLEPQVPACQVEHRHVAAKPGASQDVHAGTPPRPRSLARLRERRGLLAVEIARHVAEQAGGGYVHGTPDRRVEEVCEDAARAASPALHSIEFFAPWNS